MLIKELYQLFLQFPSIQTDSRKLKAGDIFFALKGPNFNASQFALQALYAGAAYAVVDESTGPEDSRIIKVPDVLNCLQELAKYHRQKFNIPFLAITGSNGKTTTRELIHAVLSPACKTYTTEGNLNNHIGIPLTIFYNTGYIAFMGSVSFYFFDSFTNWLQVRIIQKNKCSSIIYFNILK